MPAKKRAPARKGPAKRKPKKKIQKAKRAGKPRASLSRTSVNFTPVSTGVTVAHNEPLFHGGGRDRITISHRELLTSISSATNAWAYNDDYDINPGNAETFPWLSNIAWSWESYKIHSLAFIYEPRCPTTQAGAVQLFTDFDSADAVPALEQFASSYEGFVEAPPYKRVVHRPRVAGLQQSKGVKFVAPVTGVPVGADQTNYNSGTFYLFTTGTGTNTLGSLWVEYTIELIHPTAGVGADLRLGSSAVGSWSRFGNGNTNMVWGVTDYPVNTLKDMCGASMTPTDLVQPGTSLTIDPADYAINFPGPGVYNASFRLSLQSTSGVQVTSTPSITDIVEAASEGLKFLDTTGVWSASYAGSYTVLAVAFTFVVLKKLGKLRFLSPVYPIRYTNAAGIPVAAELDIEIGFRDVWSPPPEMKLDDYIQKFKPKKETPKTSRAPMRVEFKDSTMGKEQKDGARDKSSPG